MEEDDEYLPPVNYIESIRKGKLVYAKDRWFQFNRLMMYFFLISMLSGSLYAAIEEIPNREYSPLFFVVFVDPFIVISLVLLNTLVKVKGKKKLENKEDVMNTLHHFYDGLTFMASRTDVIRDIKRPDISGFGWCITVILKDDEVYFHKVTTTSRSPVSPIAVIPNYLKCKKIARYFQELQNNKPVADE
ncbi:hypothetical protein [Mucilaginibacter paludis]|uniref:Uncharacterized protein n=1 Tax=Mucilaginibacter paludis DSM 18603 TaxID=714943 RepID=H1Y5Y6_9SPHI|nr:hypothetical protein [Mucilaginibacter paludis]EHQ30408.1 hypothetical protein Mucpa_6354 [Mucilaginibacter paludis DSM 18603]